MKQTRLLILAGVIAMVGVGCHTHHHADHRGHREYRMHEPSGAVVVPHQDSYGHYHEHGVGRQYHRHYYPDRH